VRLAVAIVVTAIGCGNAHAPPPPPPEPKPPVVATRPARQDFDVGMSPMNLAVAGTSLVWSDSAGALWTMRSDGTGQPRQLSDQHLGFAFSIVTAGTSVLAATKKDLLRVQLPDGPVTHAKLDGLADDPEEIVADATSVYFTMFKRNEIMRVPAAGGKPVQFAELARGVLGIHGANVYAASYSTGVLVAIPTAGGTPRTIARGIPRPTAVAADDQFAFVYSEREKTIRRIALATGDTVVIGRDLENSDDLVADGAWLYLYSWAKPHRLLRLAKDGSRPPQVLADDLKSPYRIVVDADAIYVTVRDQNKIVRFDKAALDR
jgi:hypothetical protein